MYTCHVYMYIISLVCAIDVAAGIFLDKEQSRGGGGGGGGGGEGLVIPLIMQNKPPVQMEEDKLNDLPFRPDEV